MNRQENRQLAGLSRAVAVVVGYWRELSRSVAGSVETCRAVAGGVRKGTQNPPAFGLTSSSLVPGTPSLAKTYRPDSWFPPPAGEIQTDNQTDNSRRIGWVLAVQQAERDRELAAINCALRSGTAAKVLG